MTPEEIIRTASKVERVEADISNIYLLLQRMSESLVSLEVLNSKHNESREAISRAFNEIEDLNFEIKSELKGLHDRIKHIEDKVLINSFVSAGVIGGSRAILERVGWMVATLVASTLTWWVNK